MLIVRATKKLLDRIGPPTLRDGEQSTTLLGHWYATALLPARSAAQRLATTPCSPLYGENVSPDRKLAHPCSDGCQATP